jgi:prepilin-type processing-associated H-X9-DG protein
MALGVQNYEMGHGSYPVGTQEEKGPIVSLPKGYHHGWMGQILPYIEQKNAFRQTDFEVGVYDDKNLPVRKLSIRLFACPSARRASMVSCYAGVHHDQEAPIDEDNHGVFVLNRKIRYEDITDGSSQTLLIGEKYSWERDDLGWMSGTRAILRNTGAVLNEASEQPGRAYVQTELLPGMPGYLDDSGGLIESNDAGLIDLGGEAGVEDDTAVSATPGDLRVGGFASPHHGGANFAFADGSIRFLSAGIDMNVYQQLGHRADGKLLSEDW